MKRLLFLILGMSCASIFSAQESTADNQMLTEQERELISKSLVVEETDTSWKQGGICGLNASQTLLNNWAPGGQSSITGTAYMNLFKNYAKGSWTWDNTLGVSYGFLNNGIVKGNNIKIDDKIDFASKAGRKATGNWYYSGLLNFRSQFAPGYEVVDGAESDNKISDLLAPAFVLVSLGMDYKPNDNFTVFISPVTAKNTIVNNPNRGLRANYGFADDELSSAVRFEFGGYAKIAYKRALAENAEYQTKIDLFSNYLNNPQNVDVNWENLIAVKFAKYFNVNFIVQLVYDDDIKILKPVNGEDGNQLFQGVDGTPVTAGTEGAVGVTRGISTLQLRQVFGLGFSYKF